MERPGLRARRLQTLDGMPCGKARRREKLGWKNGPSSFPQASIRKVMAQKRKSPPLQVGFFVLNMVGRVGFEPTTNWLKDNWPRFL